MRHLRAALCTAGARPSLGPLTHNTRSCPALRQRPSQAAARVTDTPGPPTRASTAPWRTSLQENCRLPHIVGPGSPELRNYRAPRRHFVTRHNLWSGCPEGLGTSSCVPHPAEGGCLAAAVCWNRHRPSIDAGREQQPEGKLRCRQYLTSTSAGLHRRRQPSQSANSRSGLRQ